MQGLRLAAAVQELQGGGFVSGALSKFRRAVGVDTLDVQSTETTNAERRDRRSRPRPGSASTSPTRSISRSSRG